jgi:hypothetical protein
MKKTILMLVAFVSMGALTTSCGGSDDSSSSNSSNSLVGKWEYYQTGYAYNGQVVMEDYVHNTGCSKDYVEFFENGAINEMTYEDIFGESCYESFSEGTYVKSGNNLSVTLYDETGEVTIQTLNATTLKIKGAVEQGYYEISIFRRATN